jgi:putative tricarboxylic transport membrane protein
VLNLPLIGIWARLLMVPYRVLYPAILLITCIGVYSINKSTLDVLIAGIFGLAGFAFYRLKCEPAPLLLGFILGPMIEENMRRALLITKGDFHVFIERPISLSFLVLTLILIITLIAPAIRSTREKAFRES